MIPDRRDLLTWALALLPAPASPVSPSALPPLPTPPRRPGPLPAARIRALDQQARAGFQYQHPTPNPSRDCSDQVLARRPWRGNCMTLAITSLGLARRAGAPPGTLYFLLVQDWLHHGEHAVGMATDDQGRRWVIGDTFGRAYPYPDMRHKVIRLYRYV
jgi:hypothetical protein